MYKTKITEMRSELRGLNKLAPETMAAFSQLSKAAKEGGPLSEKEKEYVALGIAVSQRCESCINFHVEALIRVGATREELGSLLSVAVQMGGGPAVMYAAHALACWDELAAAEAGPPVAAPRVAAGA